MTAKYSRTRLADYAVDELNSNSKSKNLAKLLAAYLIDNHRTDDINSLARDILQIRADKTGTVEVTAIVAHDIDNDTRSEIKEMIRAVQPNVKKVIINQQVDSSAIGGIRLELANALLNSTVDARLAALRESTSRV